MRVVPLYTVLLLFPQRDEGRAVENVKRLLKPLDYFKEKVDGSKPTSERLKRLLEIVEEQEKRLATSAKERGKGYADILPFQEFFSSMFEFTSIGVMSDLRTTQYVGRDSPYNVINAFYVGVQTLKAYLLNKAILNEGVPMPDEDFRYLTIMERLMKGHIEDLFHLYASLGEDIGEDFHSRAQHLSGRIYEGIHELSHDFKNKEMAYLYREVERGKEEEWLERIFNTMKQKDPNVINPFWNPLLVPFLTYGYVLIFPPNEDKANVLSELHHITVDSFFSSTLSNLQSYFSPSPSRRE